jgi:glycosyltransferase involved in cell wall biosynthesis
MFSTPSKKVSAIIPAYNEADRIGRVLDTVTTYSGFHEVIVIDDSSDDGTAAVAQRYPITYLHNRGRRGKGKAMNVAVQAAQGDIIFFCDADVIGLTHDVIRDLVQPVLEEQAVMSVAVRGRGVPWLTTFFARLFPRATLIAGERALTRELWERLPDTYKEGFRIESALNFLAAQERGLVWKTFASLEHVPKELKLGLLEGAWRRIGEIIELIWITVYLQLVPIEPVQKNDRAVSQ